MRSLRLRLFAGILGAALIAVVVSLAIGVVLTRGAVRDQIADEVAAQADLIAFQLRDAGGELLLDGGPPPGAGAVEGGDVRIRGTGTRDQVIRRLRAAPFVRRLAAPPPGAPPSAGAPEPAPPPGFGDGAAPRPQVLALSQARSVLPAEAFADLRAGEAVDGQAEIGGESQLYSARRVGPAVVLAARPDSLTTDDFSDYLGGLLLAGALAALLAGLAAALMARRLAGLAAALMARRPGSRPSASERAVLLSVSHELRTPLTAIRGYAEGLEDGTVDPQTAASVVGREADRLGRLVGDLLALVKLEQGVLDIRSEPVDLAEAAHEAERRLRPQAVAAGVAVVVEDAAGAATADADRVVQVVSNLVENAIRVTPSGGRVTVGVAAGAITVADTGPGIPAEDLEHAFDRFHLRRRHGRGSPDGAGLGLAIVRELTEAMGGGVAVESAPGAGATFTVRLPAA